MTTVGIPSRLDALKEEDIPSIAERACAEAYLDYPVPRYMDTDECEAVLQQMVRQPAADAEE